VTLDGIANARHFSNVNARAGDQTRLPWW
jgi:hypothetical protein